MMSASTALYAAGKGGSSLIRSVFISFSLFFQRDGFLRPRGDGRGVEPEIRYEFLGGAGATELVLHAHAEDGGGSLLGQALRNSSAETSENGMLFNGNNYAPEWAVEAEKRGLLNLGSAAEAISRPRSRL